MKEIAEHDPNAEFILYSSSDFYYQFFLDNDSDPTPINGCIAQEIGWDKCRYVYLEDGTANYAPMYTISDQKMKEHITYFGPLRDVFGYRNLTEQEDSDIRYKALYGYALSFGPIGRSECWLSLPEAVNYLKSTTFEPAYFTKMVKKDPFKQYYDLTPEQRERFAKMLKFDVREFNSGNNKPNFIITGSNFAGNQSSQDKMMRMVKSLCAQFGVEYNMYFKGHPANTMFESMLQAEIVNGLNIKSLPQSIPAEVFIAAGYANMLAGYYSSLYFGVDHTKIYKMFVSGGYDGMAEYIREMLVPAGGYPGKDKWADFNNF